MRGWREQTASIFYRARCAVEKLTLNLLTTTIVAPPSNASKWQTGFNSAFKGLKYLFVNKLWTPVTHIRQQMHTVYVKSQIM